MKYKFTDYIVGNKDFELVESEKIHPCLLKNNYNDILKALDFLASDEKLLYIHGFLGTGKRQFVNYVCDFLSHDVIKLEYYCKESTVCDDIFLTFSEQLEKITPNKTFNLNSKISTLEVKLQKQISVIKKPIMIVLHTCDNISDENMQFVAESLTKISKEANTKIIATTHAMKPNLFGELEENRTIFLKAFTIEIFKEFLSMNNVSGSDKQIEDFYAITRGYYFYTALAVKIIQSANLKLAEFIQKIKGSNTNFDSFIGEFYINLIPTAIRNFFWFLRAIRHGISLNALAIYEIYDEFSVQYLKTNLIVFQSDEIIYLHDYFAQRVNLIIPEKVEIKLHKYIINIYENQLKESLNNRSILISRQALRAEILYHKEKIRLLESGQTAVLPQDTKNQNQSEPNKFETPSNENQDISVSKLIESAKKLVQEDKITDAIDKLQKVLDTNELDNTTLQDTRLNLARLYKKINNYQSSIHYYELLEQYYKSNKELINLNYLYYEMTDLYFNNYKHDRAIETIKKVIYSVDTPQSLMVSSCTLLGNIYTDINNLEEAYSYYQKALDSLDENVSDKILSELYFKFALANDDKGNMPIALEYYNRCISISDNDYLSPAYSNLASCYYEAWNDDDALNCFIKAYNIEKQQNNYEGIYYTASHIAEIMSKNGNPRCLDYLKDAKQSAEFINETFYIIQSSLAMGDYFYNIKGKSKEALAEYLNAKKNAELTDENIDMSSIDKRIKDMSLRMPQKSFMEIAKKYE